MSSSLNRARLGKEIKIMTQSELDQVAALGMSLYVCANAEAYCDKS